MVLINSFICWLIIKACYSYDGPEVETPLGGIRGKWKIATGGNIYSSFEGIPYAKPPVGQLRFEEPVPIESWQGFRSATDVFQCPQLALGTHEGVAGNEDCLYINVYVPGKYIKSNKNLDVVVNIHGGAFMVGSGHFMLNSTFVMNQEDTIFVSLNYRLGVLGFLSTEDNEIPGNNGMKDQVLALKWVKDNIASFGGNPNSVTISGCSAGGASVHLHYLSPLSRGLFHRGISHSGTALNPWVIKEKPLIFAKNVSVSVGCPDSSTKDMKECLKTKPYSVLLEKGMLTEFALLPFSPFSVVIERNSKNPFLSENPYSILVNGKVADLPWIASVTHDEGIFPGISFYNYLNEFDKAFIPQAHLILDYNHTLPEQKRLKFATRIKDHYFGKGQHIKEENFDKLVDVFSHRFFTYGIEVSVKLQSKANKSPVYYYVFNYDKGTNGIAKLFGQNDDIKGAGHSDDNIYAYGFNIVNNFSERDEKIIGIFKKILRPFVTGSFNLLEQYFKWVPTKGDELTYLNITSEIDLNVQKIKTMVPEHIWIDLNRVEFNMTNIKDEL